MPFQSEKQRRYLHVNHPEIAKRWEKEYAGGGTAHLNFELNQLPEYYLPVKKGGIANHFKRKKFEDGTQEDAEYLGWLKTYEINPDAAAMHPNHETYLQIYNESTMQETSSNGILDTEASEMDVTTAEAGDENTEGEMINLFAENTEDQPNAPTTLFMNRGGIMGLAKGGRIGLYPGGPPGGGDKGMHSSGTKSSDRQPGFEVSNTKTSTKTSTSTADGGADAREKYIQTQYTSPEAIAAKNKRAIKNLIELRKREKYNTWEEEFDDIPGTTKTNIYKASFNVKHKKDLYEQALANQKKKMKNWGILKAIPAAIVLAITQNPKLAMKTFSLTKNDIINVVKHSVPVMSAKKELIAALEDSKTAHLQNVDVLNPNEMKNLDDTDFPGHMKELTELTKKPPDEPDTKDDAPPVKVIPQEAKKEDFYALNLKSQLEKIREKQALRASLKAKDIIQDNEIVTDDLVTDNIVTDNIVKKDLTLLLNKGGLANLFRVKNQY